MSKAEKQRAELKTAKFMEWATIKAMLSRYGFVLFKEHTGSHFTYKHTKLEEMARYYNFRGISARYAQDGTIVVVMHHGKVYKPYLEKIDTALADIENFETVKTPKADGR